MEDNSEKDAQNLMQKNLEIAEENNKILRKMYRSMQWGRFFTLAYWGLVIGAAVGVYYFLQPLIESTFGTIGSFSENVNEAKEAISGVKTLLNGEKAE